MSTEPLAGDGGVCSGLPLQGQGGEEGGGSHWHQASPSPNPPSPALGSLHTCAIKGEQAITLVLPKKCEIIFSHHVPFMRKS